MWVFGYGSLMWDPGFEADERSIATLGGWHRSFCMRSIHYRGTPEQPGLVLALDEATGGACGGIAWRVDPPRADGVLAYLRERELISDAYLERVLPVRLTDGREVQAVTYVIDHAHPQYIAGLSLDEQAAIIAVARGQTGRNADYLWNTVAHLSAEGLADPDLDWLAGRVRALLA